MGPGVFVVWVRTLADTFSRHPTPDSRFRDRRSDVVRTSLATGLRSVRLLWTPEDAGNRWGRRPPFTTSSSRGKRREGVTTPRGRYTTLFGPVRSLSGTSKGTCAMSRTGSSNRPPNIWGEGRVHPGAVPSKYCPYYPELPLS